MEKELVRLQRQSKTKKKTNKQKNKTITFLFVSFRLFVLFVCFFYEEAAAAIGNSVENEIIKEREREREREIEKKKEPVKPPPSLVEKKQKERAFQRGKHRKNEKKRN